MGREQRANPNSQAKRAGTLAPKKKQLTFKQKLAEARIMRFQSKMRRKNDGS